MEMNRKYWKGMDELKETSSFIESGNQEFPAETSVEEFLSDDNLKESSTGRRDFLKFLGFSVAAATVAACEAPVTKAIPYVNKPENVTPGMPTWYASTYYDGNNYASILVKTREGRPIYIKGNKDQGITKGGSNAQIIASILGLYDSSRLTMPQMKKGGEWEASKFSAADKKVKSALKSAKSVVLVSNTVISPSLSWAIGDLAESLGETRDPESGVFTENKFQHIQYDAVSYAGMRAANKASFGLEENGNGIIPTYDFSKAHTIVSVGADFLGTWLMPTAFAGQYAETRNPDGEWMSKHFQFEALMSMTGSNADVRAMVKPSEYANVLAVIAKEVGADVSGVSTKLDEKAQEAAKKAGKALKASGKKSILVCGSNNTALQILTNKINDKLGAYNETINVNETIQLFQSNDSAMNKFVSNTISGKGPDAVIFLDTNPVYTHPNGEKLGKALKNIKHKISMASHADETANNCDVIVPDHHALEAWMDFKPTKSHYAVAQPAIRPLGNTASSLESVLVWAGKASRGGKDSKVGYDYIQDLWKQWGYAMDPMVQSMYPTFEGFWNEVVHGSTGDSGKVAAPTSPAFNSSAWSKVSGKLPKGGGTEVVMYQKAGIGIGTQANNPWLQELPDPLTKITWDNYITMNPVEMDGMAVTFDQENGLDLADLTVNGKTVTLPVYPLPGQALGTVGVALGYGRGANGEDIGTAAYQTKEYGGNEMLENGNPKPIGANAFPFVKTENGTLSYDASGAKVTQKNETYLVAGTQIHSTAMARHSIVRETTLDIYNKKDRTAFNPEHMLSKLDKDGKHVKAPVGEFDLWDEHPVENIGHRWGMTVDLSSCIGCSACLVACQSENNVPVVGKDEVRRGREMHWLRIDRYYASDVEAAVGTRTDEFDYIAAEKPAENPAVVHMPMMCHHCNHAPCETVCPVAATTHSNEGLNQMTYNRCIGTRYCANNCPYKVRRFNWFNYPSYKKFTEINPAQDDLGRMVLNPDVTVRTRGVMEKCSFCVQRIQAGKLEAKIDGRPVQDGDYSTACSDACPTNAIIVGDWNDSESLIRKSADNHRAYQALEEVGVKPNVWFKVKVRNEDNSLLDKLQKEDAHHGGHGEHEAEAGH